MNEEIQEILDGLSLIEQDNDVPKNIRTKVRAAIEILTDNSRELDLKIDKSLETLGEVADDPSVPQHTRMQIWSLVSQLETNK